MSKAAFTRTSGKLVAVTTSKSRICDSLMGHQMFGKLPSSDLLYLAVYVARLDLTAVISHTSPGYNGVLRQDAWHLAGPLLGCLAQYNACP